MKKFSLIEKLLKTFDKYAILVAVIALFSVIVFYLATFNQGLRKDNGDWRTFGNEAWAFPVVKGLCVVVHKKV